MKRDDVECPERYGVCVISASSLNGVWIKQILFTQPSNRQKPQPEADLARAAEATALAETAAVAAQQRRPRESDEEVGKEAKRGGNQVWYWKLFGQVWREF